SGCSPEPPRRACGSRSTAAISSRSRETRSRGRARTLRRVPGEGGGPRCYDPSRLAPTRREAMAETADAIIIGAGIMGSATAYHLMRRRYGRVVVLERDGICSGSTALASGGVRHQYANRVGIALTQQSIVV